MSEEFGNDLVTITDEDGNVYALEHVDTLEIDEIFYMAFLPTDINEDDDEFGLVILKVIEEDGEEILTTIDDEVLLEDIYNQFLERL